MLFLTKSEHVIEFLKENIGFFIYVMDFDRAVQEAWMSSFDAVQYSLGAIYLSQVLTFDFVVETISNFFGDIFIVVCS